MPIANVSLNNTFDEWRTVTNQVISFVNDIDSGNLTRFYSNTAALTVTENVSRGGKNYITLNVSSSVLDRSTLNVATANAVNIVFAALANTDARVIVVSNSGNDTVAITNAAIIQANIARDQANAAFNSANTGLGLGSAFVQANTARDHANAAFSAANNAVTDYSPAFIQANTARVHANVSFGQANTSRIHANVSFEQANTARVHANNSFEKANIAFDLASFASGNGANTLISNKAAYDQANTARDHANVSFEQANTSRVHANASFEQANTARVHANVSFERANTARVHANVSFEQANTARVHANTAHASANAGLLQANTARDHANAAFAQANVGFSNTSGSSFVGNMQIPTGNLTIGEGVTQGIRIYANGWIGVANVLPQIKAVNGTQFINLNANTNVGGWNDLMLDRDLSIIYSRGASDDGANLIIGPWTDSSFGYKQDGAGRHGFNTSNPRQVLDANGAANISGPLLVWNTRSDQAMNVVPTITAAFAKANTIGTLTAAGGVVYAFSTSEIRATAAGTSGQVLTSAGSGVPTWTSQSSLSVGYASSAGAASVAASLYTNSDYQVDSFGVGTAPSGTSGQIRASGEITAYYSDVRLKTNINPIINALDKVRSISGVTYQSNDIAEQYGYTDKRVQVGVIAQEIEAVLPEIVVPAPFDIEKNDDGTEYSKSGENYKTVQYEKLIPLLIEAIKELSKQVEELKNR